MIPFDDVGDFGDFDGFAADGDDPFDLNFDIELDDGDLPGMAFQTDQFPSAARRLRRRETREKKTHRDDTGQAWRARRTRRIRTRGRGVASGAATDVSEMGSGGFPAPAR